MRGARNIAMPNALLSLYWGGLVRATSRRRSARNAMKP
jgi:hypothetical protein